MEKRAQTGNEYLLLISGVMLVAILVVLLVRGTIIPQSMNRSANATVQYLDFMKCVSGNLAKNPSFEERVNNKPRYWTDNGAVGSGGLTAGDYYSGERSIVLTAGAWRDYHQNVSITPSAGHVVSLQWKGGNCSYLDVREWNGNTPVTAWQGTNAKARETAAWGQDIYSFTTAATTNKLSIKFGVVPNGQKGCNYAGPYAPTFFDAVCVYRQT